MKNFTKILAGAVLAVALVSASSADAAMTWSRSLKQGSKGADVKSLQQFLNMCADTKVSMSGAGSPGMESTTFGPATKAAVIKWQMARGVMPASGLFGPLSRAKAAELQASSNVCGGGVVVTPPTGTQTGPVMASLSATTPAAGYLVDNQATAGLLDVTFTGSGVVNSVTLMRTGISDQNTLSNVYLYDGVTRLTDGYSFNNQSTLVMNNLNIMVNGSKTISVKADLASNASSNSTIAIALTNFTSGASVNSVNILGNLMNLASGSSLAQIGVVAGSNVSAATVNAGTSSYVVWRKAFQVNTRTLSLKAANFRVTGSAPSDALQNVGLYIDGVKAGNNGSMQMINGSNYVTFDMTGSPVALTTGSHTFEVRGDIVKGSSYNFTVSLQQASDLMVMDPQVGINIAACGGTTWTLGVCQNAFTAQTAGQISIGTGSVTATVDPTFSTYTNVTGGASNAVIGKFKLHAYGEDVKITSLPVSVSLSSAATPAGIQNVTVYFNGSQVGSQVSLSSGTGSLAADCVSVGTGTCYSNTFSLGSQMIVPAGTDSYVEIRADLRNSSGTNYTAGAVSANLGVATGEGWNSKASITTPAATGTSLTVQTGLLAVSKNTGYANQSINPNTAGVKIGSFVLQNQSSSESVRVTSLTVAPVGAGTSALTNISGLRTSETSGSGATPVQPQSTNTFTVDFTLAPGATKTIDILADTSSTTSVTLIPTLAVTALGASSNTSISVSAVTGQTMTISSGTVATPTLLTATSTAAQYVAAAGGAADATKASYSFVSTGGASTISELKFTVTGTATDPVMSVKIGAVTAPVVGGIAWLQGLNIAVPNGGSGASVDALITYAPVGTGGVTPNTTSIVSLTYVKYTSGGTTATLSPLVAAPTITVVGSKPTVTIPTATASGLSISGETKIGEVTVSADSKGNVKINDMVFTVSSSGFSTAPTAIGSPRIADGTTTIAGSACTPSSLVVTCEFGTTSNTDFDGYTIAAGSTKTFSVYGTLTGAAATGSGIPTVTSSLGVSTFNWDDSSTNGASGTNLSGTLLYGFPTNSYSIKQ